MVALRASYGITDGWILSIFTDLNLKKKWVVFQPDHGKWEILPIGVVKLAGD